MSTTDKSTAGKQEIHVQPSNRLTLCFDGTGNMFQGTPGDTNIVKLYKMLDRGNPSQMHYYQPGIGTYPADGPVNVSWLRSLMRKLEATLDSALATSFDSHVIAGYRFIMRYYKPGDRIYIFGFSRGAFTARFLSRMVSQVGLLSMGNEELVPFAYKVYQDYEQNSIEEGPKQDARVKYMKSFKEHFCRTDLEAHKHSTEDGSASQNGIKVHFLGLFDCVNSVGNLDVPFFKRMPPLPAVGGTAEHVRHAVAVDERRVKFKAALFSQEQHAVPEDIKEVWFPGNHGDVGGGWDVGEKKVAQESKDEEEDYFQLSDIALKWMIDEVDDVESKYESIEPLAWHDKSKASFLRRFHKHQSEMISARMHDTMKRGGGSSIFKVILWNFMELIPWVIRRWEYVEYPRMSKSYKWDYIGWPPNLGGRRDIPSTALFHRSVIGRMQFEPKEDPKEYYCPNNHLWVRSSNDQLTKGSSSDLTVDVNAAGQRVVKSNLIELARQYTPEHDCKHDSERARLLEYRIRFERIDNLTKGSAPIKGERVEVGGKEWDGIYKVSQAS